MYKKLACQRIWKPSLNKPRRRKDATYARFHSHVTRNTVLPFHGDVTRAHGLAHRFPCSGRHHIRIAFRTRHAVWTHATHVLVREERHPTVTAFRRRDHVLREFAANVIEWRRAAEHLLNAERRLMGKADSMLLAPAARQRVDAERTTNTYRSDFVFDGIPAFNDCDACLQDPKYPQMHRFSNECHEEQQPCESKTVASTHHYCTRKCPAASTGALVLDWRHVLAIFDCKPIDFFRDGRIRIDIHDRCRSRSRSRRCRDCRRLLAMLKHSMGLLYVHPMHPGLHFWLGS